MADWLDTLTTDERAVLHYIVECAASDGPPGDPQAELVQRLEAHPQLALKSLALKLAAAPHADAASRSINTLGTAEGTVHLARMIRAAFPLATVEVDLPLHDHDHGKHHIDIRLGDRLVIVEWSEHGVGVSLVLDATLDGGPDFRLADADGAFGIVKLLLSDGPVRHTLGTSRSATHTYAILNVSAATYAEIRSNLAIAGYGNAFHPVGYGRERIDMHGIALEIA
jgi:hypothetical protein